MSGEKTGRIGAKEIVGAAGMLAAAGIQACLPAAKIAKAIILIFPRVRPVSVNNSTASEETKCQNPSLIAV